VRRCDFPDALRHIAELAGFRLEDSKHPDVRREMVVRKQHRERLESAAHKLKAMERQLRLQCGYRIHLGERRFAALSDATAWTECDWLTASAYWVRLQRDLTAYTVLSFADPAERARFVLHPELRDQIIAGVRFAGYVRTASGKQVEVFT
jgi:hypothetical protein